MYHLAKNCSFIALTAAALLLTAWAGTAVAQDSNESVAEAAKKAREHKKESKPVRTFTNDDLPKAPESQAAPQPASGTDGSVSGSAADAAGKKDQAATGKDQKDEQKTDKKSETENLDTKKSEAEAELESAKKDLKQAAGELDVMKRKLALDSDSYYAKTDFASDTDGKAALDAEGQQITDKKDAVEKLKARVAELQAKLDELTGAPAPAPDQNPDQGKTPPRS